MTNDRKQHDGTIPIDLEDDPAFVKPEPSTVPALLPDERTTDPTEYGPAALQLLQQIAFADMGEFFEWGPGGVRVKASVELTPAQRRLVQGVKEDKDGNIVITLCSKDHAIRLLGQASGIISENVKHSGKVDIGLLDVLKALDGRSRGLPPKLGKP